MLKIIKGQYADMIILNKDYFSMPIDDIRNIHSVLTIVNGKTVYGEGEYKKFDLPPPQVVPSWSPVKYYGGFQNK